MALNKESRTVNAAKNASSAFINKTVFMLLTFISRRFFIQFIGVEYLGINGLFTNVLTLLSMADLGVGTAMNVSLYKPIAENDTRKLAALMAFYSRLYVIIAVGVTAIGLILIPFLPFLVNLDSEIPHLYLYYIVFVLKNTASYLFVYKSSMLRADQKTYKINTIEVYLNAAKLILQLMVIILLKSYLCYILLDVLCVVFENLWISHVADKQYPFIKQKEELSKEEKKGIFSEMSSIFLYKISASLLTGTYNILISVIVGTVFVGYYSNYLTITHVLDTFIALLFSSLTASVGNLVATSTADNRYSTFKTMQMVSFWICGFVSVSLFILLQDFIVLWVGEKLLLDNLTMLAIVVNMFFSTCMRPIWTFREGTGMYKQIRYIMVVTAAVNLILSIVFGKLLGISGILFATSISKLVTQFWYEPNILFRNFFKRNVKGYYVDFIQNVALVVVCCAVCYFLTSWIQDVSVLAWLSKALICTVVVNAIYFILLYRRPEYANIKNKLLHLIHRKDAAKRS